MVIVISDLAKKKSFKKDINFSYKKDKLVFNNEEIIFTKPINVAGFVSSIGEIVNFEAKISTELKLSCSRCLEKFVYPVNIEIDEKFSNNQENEDEDMIIINGDEIDIAEAVENGIIMSLPIKKLCSENCKGLCQQCGTNLNLNSCDCGNNNIDPRLAKLKDLFSTD